MTVTGIGELGAGKAGKAFAAPEPVAGALVATGAAVGVVPVAPVDVAVVPFAVVDPPAGAHATNRTSATSALPTRSGCTALPTRIRIAQPSRSQ
ncbi:MAG: hypothetical protein JO352_05390 [Chloroflexi bacterium]|nr:hypothetical protein [Chloroflexota bacterium]MBV9597539.1 hypothetical protein [Chloroflexota bacterium]